MEFKSWCFCVIVRFSRNFRGWNVIERNWEYRVCNTVLDLVYSHKDLGVLVNNQLRFHSHIHDIVHKAAGLASNLLHSVN